MVVVLNDLQFRSLRERLAYVFEHSQFYRRRFRDADVDPRDIGSLKDFVEKIPFTTKDDLRMYNDDFLCVPKSQVVDVTATAGTTGTPIFVYRTRRDWEVYVESKMRSLVELGIKDSDVFQISTAFDQLYFGAIFFDYASKRLGITVLRMGPSNLRRQLEVMRRLETTVIYTTPGHMLLLTEEAERMGMNPQKDFNLRMGMFVAQSLHTEDWQPNALNHRIREEWGIEVYSGYGSTEMMVGCWECKQHGGHHVEDDLLFVEIVDPATGLPVPPGELGEIVFTHLSWEGMPLIRFRQGDISRLETQRCVCGKTAQRIMSVIGRVDDMMKIKGVSVYPAQIEEALSEVSGVTAYVIEAYTDRRGIDRIRIRVAFEGSKEMVFEEVEKAVRSRARITPDVLKPISREEALKILYSMGTRKPKTFWDKRKTGP
jgi:phenylacetate-CoA ligase